MPFPTPQHMITPVANSNLQHSPVDWLTSPIVRHKNRKFKPLCKTEPIAIAPEEQLNIEGGCHKLPQYLLCANFFWMLDQYVNGTVIILNHIKCNTNFEMEPGNSHAGHMPLPPPSLILWTPRSTYKWHGELLHSSLEIHLKYLGIP